jgi:hypothetical protein
LTQTAPQKCGLLPVGNWAVGALFDANVTFVGTASVNNAFFKVEVEKQDRQAASTRKSA